jgi:hypothetical protein
MTEREVIAGVLGMVIGLASSMIGIVLQHILSLRADRIKRERDREDEEEREMREIARKAEPSFFRRARYIKWLGKSKGKK